MPNTDVIAGLLDFLRRSPTPFHAVANMACELEKNGFQRLREADRWDLRPGERYYTERNGSSMVAFGLPGDPVTDGIRMIGAHTDSPCLKIKPEPDITAHGYLQLGVEVYGGALLNPWFDRDLSIAGRLTYVDRNGALTHALIDFERPVAVIPSLAIHLDREANTSRAVNAQNDLPPIVAVDNAQSFRSWLLERLKAQYPDTTADEVSDYELCLYDTQPAARVGMDDEFIAGARLDNLVSCYIGLRSLLDESGDRPGLLICNDHEEVGSVSSIGAQGTFLKSIVERIAGSRETFTRVVDRSMLISADNAHGVHPNFADRHDKNHGPLLNGGPVIKINANQRYASNSETSGVFRHVCKQLDIPLQTFVIRSDMACGSTIGPLTASEVGVRTLDIGIPQFAMHSVRELCGTADIGHLYRALRGFLRTPVSLIPA
ncbi:MAG: M18 family aminopeptidase [Gammaproteobacteria bacterium]|nr:M18 family aminopeptidase [Gammaproteobacteria bacterium]